MCDLRIEQGLAQINALLDYIGTGHKIGDVMDISLRSLQVEAGTSSDILASPSKELHHYGPTGTIDFLQGWRAQSLLK
jgi:hypothetical protein